MPNTNERDALMLLVEQYAEARHKHGGPEYNHTSNAARNAVIAALAATAPNAGVPTAEDAARWVEKRMNDFIHEHGYTDPDTGALEFGRGAHAEEKREYVGDLEEIIAGIRSLMVCNAAPDGWSCSRAQGHSGPCAAAPAQQAGAPLPLAPAKDVTNDQIRSLWQTIDTGDIEDDIMSFARALLDSARPCASPASPQVVSWTDPNNCWNKKDAQ